jgi:hypothetical protein
MVMRFSFTSLDRAKHMIDIILALGIAAELEAAGWQYWNVVTTTAVLAHADALLEAL